MADKKEQSTRHLTCTRCGRPAIRCFAGTHNGVPVVQRYYCQADRLQMIVLLDDVLVELADGDPPESAGPLRMAGRISTGLSWLRARPSR